MEQNLTLELHQNNLYLYLSLCNFFFFFFNSTKLVEQCYLIFKVYIPKNSANIVV